MCSASLQSRLRHIRCRDPRLQTRLDRPKANHRMFGRNLERNAEIGNDASRARGRRTNAQPVRTVRNTLEQEEPVEIGARRADDLAGTVDQLQIDTFEAELAALDQSTLDITTADQRDCDIGGNTWPRNDNLQRLFWDQHWVIEA